MSEGRTPTATLTEQRRLEQEDIDILHQIVIRAQNDPQSPENPKDALLQAYGEIFTERKLSQHQDRACFNVLLRLLNPATPGESLYHKFEGVLRAEGIVLDFDDDTNVSGSARGSSDGRVTEHLSDRLRPTSTPSQQFPLSDHSSPVQPQGNRIVPETAEQSPYPDPPPAYIASLMEVAIRKDQRALIKQTLEAFQRAIEIGRNHRDEALANAYYEAKLKRKTLKQCLAVFQDIQAAQNQAEQIYSHKLARDAFIKTADEYRVRRLDSIDQDRIKGLSLYKWALAGRESYFVRKKEWQLKGNFYQKLMTTYRRTQVQQYQMNHILQNSDFQNRSNLLRSALVFLAQKTTTVRQEEARADERNNAVLCTTAISAWRTSAGKLTDLALTSEDAREYFLMKRVFRRLRALTQYRKERKAWLATWTLGKWREFVKSRRHDRYDEAYRQMRRTVKVNLARKLLHLWQKKVHDLRVHASRADKFYHSSILQRLARPVVEMTWDTADWSTKNAILADEKAVQFLQQRALIALQQRQQYLEDMTDRGDRLRQYRLEQRAVQGLRQMHLKAFELQRRQLDADAFLDRHDKRGVRNILSKMRRVVAEQQGGDEGPLELLPAPAITPARKREELLFDTSTRLSTTPAYTPFSARLRSGPRVLDDIDDVEELDTAHEQDTFMDGDVGG